MEEQELFVCGEASGRQPYDRGSIPTVFEVISHGIGNYYILCPRHIQSSRKGDKVLLRETTNGRPWSRNHFPQTTFKHHMLLSMLTLVICSF